MKAITIPSILVSISLLIVIFLMPVGINAQTIKTVGTGGNYTTLKAAFDAVNAGTITGDIELQIISNTTETSFPENTGPLLNASGSGSASYTSVAIYPTGIGGYTISTADFYQLIILNGADNVTIDGRVNRTGATIALTLEHQHTASDRARTIEFINSAERNTIRYCNVTSSLRAIASGVIHFAGTNQANANNYNVIEYCDITHTAGSRTRHLLFSNGQGLSNPNTGNIVRFNNFYNFMNPSEFNTTSDGRLSTAIHLSAHSSNWTITGNSFYETTNFASTNDMNYQVIRVNTGNYHHTITNNYIGGSQPQCGGSAWRAKSTALHRFTGIYYSSSSTTNTSMVQNNIISNFDIESRSTNPWQGIDVNSLSSNNIEISSNTIGAKLGNGAILIGSDIGSGNGMNTIGIRFFGPGNYTVSNNSIGAITASASSNQTHNLYGISQESGSANLTIADNLIGSEATANSMQTQFGALRGIHIGGNSPNVSIKNNTIRNLSSADDSNKPDASSTIGILIISTGTGEHEIDDNVISNLSTNTENTTDLALTGIAVNTTYTIMRRIRRNKVHDLSNTSNQNVAVHVYGIYHAAGSNQTIANGRISENFIHSLYLSSTSNNATAAGIRINTGRAEYVNNIINIGGGLSGGYNVYGILHTGFRYNRYYFNTVYIGGSVTGGNNTYAFYKSIANAETSAFNDDLRNNIFSNSRNSSSGSAKHYAISLPGTVKLTINYNNYYAPNSGGVLGYLGGDQTTLDAWKDATGQDANSLNTDPQFANAGGTDASDYIPAATLGGQTISGFTTDYFGASRTSPHIMGALLKSYVIWTGTTSMDWASNINWKDNNAPVTASNVIIPDVTNDPVIASTDNTINSLNIEAGGKLTIAHNGSLSVANNLNNIHGADGLVIKSTASGTGSLIHHTAAVAATVERYIVGGWESWDAGWHLISSPVAAQPIEAFTTTGAGNDYDFYGWEEPSQTWKNYKAAWFSDWNNGTNFNIGQGYLISNEAGTVTQSFSGTLNISNVQKTQLTQSNGDYSGWHLLGNPFASALQWNNGNWGLDNIAGTAKIWHEGNKSYSDIDPDGIIPSAQGFMVQVTESSGGSLVIPASGRVHDSQSWYKTNDTPKIQLMAVEQHIHSAQESNILIVPGSTETFHKYHDSRFIDGYAPKFYSLKGAEKLSSHTLPALPNDLIIPFGFEKNNGNSFHIQLTNTIPDITLYLLDLKLDQEHKLTMDNPYAFESTDGDNPLRFELHFSKTGETTDIVDTTDDISGKIWHYANRLYVKSIDDATKVYIYDVNGRQLRHFHPGIGEHSYPINLPAGVYIVNMRTKTSQQSLRIVRDISSRED